MQIIASLGGNYSLYPFTLSIPYCTGYVSRVNCIRLLETDVVTYLISGSTDGHLVVWQVDGPTNHNLVCRFQAHVDSVTNISVILQEVMLALIIWKTNPHAVMWIRIYFIRIHKIWWIWNKTESRLIKSPNWFRHIRRMSAMMASISLFLRSLFQQCQCWTVLHYIPLDPEPDPRSQMYPDPHHWPHGYMNTYAEPILWA